MNTYILVTDGSIDSPHVKSNGGYAYRFSRIYNNGDKELILSGGGGERETTNNRMELSAISEGLKRVNEYFMSHDFNKDDNIIVISDSGYSVLSFTKYIFGWLKRMIDGVLINSEKKPVINQDIILEGYKTIVALAHMVKLHIFHINSHLNKNEKDRRAAKEKFAEKNNCLITDELFNSIVEENEIVDTMAREYMMEQGERIK